MGDIIEQGPAADEPRAGGVGEGSSPDLPARVVDSLPPTLPIVISADGPIFPGMMSPIGVSDKLSAQTLAAAGAMVGVVALRPQADPIGEELDPRFLFEVGCVCRVMQKTRNEQGQPTVVVMAVRRMKIRRFLSKGPVLMAEVEYPEEVIQEQRDVAALFQRGVQSFKELISLNPDFPDDMARVLKEVDEPGQLSDFVAYTLGKDAEVKQGMLSSFELDSRLRQALLMIEKDLDLARLASKLREEIRAKIEDRQKEHYLREQMQAIRRELGEEVDQRELDQQTYLQKIEEAGLTGEAGERARKELERLSLLPAEASEYHVIRNYLDWLVELPWASISDESIDLGKAARILDEDHHGLKEVKDRILEFLAVRKLRPDQQGAILCLVGPPGVGKTSLGRSVARATGREFYRVSLGGMRDEAEIKGHRRTYVGAMPGKIIQGLRRVGTRNPVFMLDELDKLSSDWRGDPSSALLEVLDPAQNDTFEDLYIDLPFDLSKVMLIATANVASQIPRPLLDRTEMIALPGYIPREKQAIASKYLVPRQLEANGLTSAHLRLLPRALAAIVDKYTREAGVRQLERAIGRVCRKVAFQVASLADGATLEKVKVAPKDLERFLGPPRVIRETVERIRVPGVVMGLAWTSSGGEILFIEATSMSGRGRLELTGHLGKVMTESASIALSVIRSRADQFKLPSDIFNTWDIHLHVPAGAVPKDGPSAGVAITCALLSLMWRGKGRIARAKMAMTGEITLRGLVLPVGGIREKLIGARRAGIKTVVLPGRNEPDVKEIPPEVLKGLKLIFVSRIEEAVEAVIGPLPK